jgi:8-oxo-dGTP pyrophosphatase MutT (NUDIX family)
MKSAKKTPFCSNCGYYGHFLKNCIAPVTSYGCIIFKMPKGFNQANELLKNNNSVSGFELYQKDIKYLMIQRRDSLGFIEIMRGKYRINDLDYIKYHISCMTEDEHKKILSYDFDTLWLGLWGNPKEQSINYKNDKENAKQKFELLKVGSIDTPRSDLKSLIEDVVNVWKTPEWGFPKGRRDIRESDLQCALRELEEETGIRDKDIIYIRNLEPISETFFGSNHIHYCHKYYLFMYNSDKELKFDKDNKFMTQEIGDLGWFSLEECMDKIRPENIEKKEVLLRASSLLRNYCPLRMI